MLLHFKVIILEKKTEYLYKEYEFSKDSYNHNETVKLRIIEIYAVFLGIFFGFLTLLFGNPSILDSYLVLITLPALNIILSILGGCLLITIIKNAYKNDEFYTQINSIRQFFINFNEGQIIQDYILLPKYPHVTLGCCRPWKLSRKKIIDIVKKIVKKILEVELEFDLYEKPITEKILNKMEFKSSRVFLDDKVIFFMTILLFLNEIMFPFILLSNLLLFFIILITPLSISIFCLYWFIDSQNKSLVRNHINNLKFIKIKIGNGVEEKENKIEPSRVIVWKYLFDPEKYRKKESNK